MPEREFTMGAFEFWEKCGSELNDKQFANAFIALGVLAATSEKLTDADRFGVHKLSDEAALKFISVANFMTVLDNLLSDALRENTFCRWQFPLPDMLVKIGDSIIKLSSLKLDMLAKSWADRLVYYGLNTDLMVVGRPASGSIRPWFRLFFEAVKNTSAFIDLGELKEAHLHFKWPLRLGFLPGDRAEESILKARNHKATKDLTTAVRIDREHANCDVLIFNGSCGQLLDALLSSPVQLKVNLFVVRGTFDEDSANLDKLLAAVAAKSHASGFILLDPSLADETLVHALICFVYQLARNLPVNRAVFRAFTESYQTDPVIFLDKDIANFQIESVFEKIEGRHRDMRDTASSRREPDSFLGIKSMEVPKENLGDEKAAIESKPRIRAKPKKDGIVDQIYRRARSMAKKSKKIDHAESQAIDESQNQRFLQRQILLKKDKKIIEEPKAFLKGVPTLIRVRIGPPDEAWPGIDTAFPDDKLPKSQEEWRLTVVLTEPNHPKETFREFIKLPRYGPSTECEFRVQPGNHAIFEARITVLHRGRVLQTGVLSGRVVVAESDILNNDTISFTDMVSVRSRIGDLEGRRQYDASFVLNHGVDARPRLTAIAANHAWLTEITKCQEITREINDELTRVAESVKDYSGGLGSKENVEMLVKLAQIGRNLYGEIVVDQIKEADNQSSFASMEYLQVVSTKADALLPLEFIYDAIAPNNDAALCPSMAAVVLEKKRGKRINAAKALVEGTCQEVDRGVKTCQYRTKEYVCPMGFWGVSKVIERHMATPRLAEPGAAYFLQSEPTTSRGELNLQGTAIVAASERVKPPAILNPVLSACEELSGEQPREAKDWAQWITMVREFKPHILIALPHTDGNGASATLEIGGQLILSGQITESHVHATGESTYPIVALLGCDTLGTALDYGSHVSWFRRGGASLVISTIAKVFGGHAVTVAEQLVKGLTQKTEQSERVGEIIRTIKRQALIDGTLMALCIVAFGDADWKLNGKEKTGG